MNIPGLQGLTEELRGRGDELMGLLTEIRDQLINTNDLLTQIANNTDEELL